LAGSNKFIVWQYLKDLAKYYYLRNYDLQISAEKAAELPGITMLEVLF